MRTARLKGKPGLDRLFFHCISRVVDKRFVFGDAEKDEFVRMMRRYEAFCGVRIVTYCVMGNHFHLLVEVPKRPETPEDMPSDDELWERAAALYGENGCATLRQRWDWLLEQKARGQYVDDALDAIRESFTARMWDISQFMKGLKQRFTQWFNRTHNRVGTLWESRFKSVLVEGTGESLSTMAAYIDLNPVRANMVADPAEYRWCGYGEAMAGGLRAQEGIHVVAQANNLSGGKPFSLEDAQVRKSKAQTPTETESSCIADSRVKKCAASLRKAENSAANSCHQSVWGPDQENSLPQGGPECRIPQEPFMDAPCF